MAAKPEPFRILAPVGFHQKLSRRSLIKLGGAAGGLMIVGAACGDDDDDDDGGTTGTDGGGDSGEPQASGDWSRVINKAGGTLAMYTWGEYNDPDIIGSLAEDALGVTMKVDYYVSNEDLITKLSTSNGASGFDIIVPTGPYIPQMIDKDLIEKFDKSLLPNMVNVDPLYLGQSWDPTNDYSVCKDWGTTGYMWDSAVITQDITSWQDFFDVCIGEASGNCSWLDTPVNVTGPYFWANGINWTTEEAADLDACEDYLVNEIAPHIKAFDSYPSTAIAEGAFAASMIWNGDGRAAYVRIAEAGGDPSTWKWGIGAPATELWMDNYCIAKGAPNAEAAHAWINWLLVPEVSIRDLNYHGYNSGLKNMPQLIEELLPDLVDGDMIFFDDAQVAAMETGAVNSAQDRLVEIFDKVKAAAAG